MASAGAHGTTLTFRLNTGARVHVTLERLMPGHRMKQGHKCVAGRGHGRVCTAQSKVKAMTVNGNAGTNTAALGAGLAPGNYLVIVTVSGWSSAPVTVRFTERKHGAAGKKHKVD